MAEGKAGQGWAMICTVVALATLASCGGGITTEGAEMAPTTVARTVTSAVQSSSTTTPTSTTALPTTTLPPTTSTTFPAREGACGVLDDATLIEIFGVPPDEFSELPGQCVFVFEGSDWALIVTPRDTPVAQLLVDFGPSGDSYVPLASEPKILVSGPSALIDLGSTSMNLAVGTPEGAAEELSEAETAERDRILEEASRAVLERLGE
jgi:hypothetical protein